jgi:signal transduction histidine kinase
MRVRSRNGVAFDALVALAAAFLGVTIFLSFGIDEAGWSAGIVGLVLVNTLCLFWRRVAPWAVLAVNLVTGLAIVGLGVPMVVLNLAPLIALYSTAARVPRLDSLWALVAVIVAYVTGAAVGGFDGDAATVVGNLIAIGSAWLLGTTVFARADYITQLEARAIELQQAREELAKQAVEEERVRIARELHDIVAHSLSIIAVQSGMGAHVIDEQPAEAKRALAAIEEVSRSALNEMRRLLGVLRSDGEEAALGPMPGLEGIRNLVDSVTQAGTQVDLRVEGEARPLSPGIDLTGYRIVQESLTNVVKHSHATKARVTVDYEPDLVRIEVVDNGTTSPSVNGFGHGIAGMRERVALFGGRIEVGPLRDEGFRVMAELPLQESVR